MSSGTSPVRSATGSRGYVRIGRAGFLARRYSVGSIALGSRNISSQNDERTWWLDKDFDTFGNTKLSGYYILPCDHATFTLGDDLYKSAEDAVPGTMRVRASRCGAYSFNISFPIIVTNDPYIKETYSILEDFIQNANYMLSLNTSLQENNYSCILENFSISANGYNGISPINCQLVTKGISSSANMNKKFLTRSFLTDTTRRDKETRELGNEAYDASFEWPYDAPTATGHANIYGGRFANIKDCAVSLNNSTFQQIVSMDLNIQHTLKLASTAKKELFNTPTIKSADRIFLIERIIKGSFKVLESYTTLVDISSLDIVDIEESKLATYNSGYHQWASPLIMEFGKDMVFDMPAVYWQPKIEEISTGSPLITINFIARSNIHGINEFRDGLP